MTKKGAARLSAATVIEKLGDPNHPETFLTIDSNEQKLGAYVGFNNVSHFRLLILSWPVLKAYLAFEPISKGMNRKTAFRLLHDDEEQFIAVNAEEKWPIVDTDSKAIQTNKLHRHITCILLQMEADLRTLRTQNLVYNRENQLDYVRLFTEAYGTGDGRIELTLIDLFPSRNGVALRVNNPRLGPYAGESRIEVFNRCWNLLKYFGYCHRSSGMWPKKVTQSCDIDRSYAPDWLLPPKEIERPDSLQKAPAIVAADVLDPLPINIIWKKDLAFDEKDELDGALTTAESKGIPIPNTSQIIKQDPRLSSSLNSFKDSIRRQYNCQELLINIRSLTLQYRSPQGSETLDLLRADWAKTKSTFSNSANANFTLRVVFQALDDPEDSVYESFETPPALSAFFDTSSGDVATKTDGLKAIADAAFDTQEQKPPSPTSKIPTEGVGLLAFLDLVFSCGGSSNSIGSCPDPKKKFPRPEDHEALLRYYDGFDVTTEQGMRYYQRETANLITKNSTVAAVKLDKLPRTFTREQKAAIEEAQSRGQCAAMATEEESENGHNVSLQLQSTFGC